MYPIEDATYDDAVTYVSLLFSLAQVDGVDEQESSAIKQLVNENGWSIEIFEEAKSKSHITIESLNLSAEAVEVFGPYLIRDLCAIAHISHGFTTKEDELIHSISKKVGVSDQKYGMIKVAVKSQMEALINWSGVLA